MSRTLPGDLTSPTAGPLLQRGMTINVLRQTPEDPEGESAEGFRVRVGGSATVTDAGANGDWCVVSSVTVDNTGPAWSQLATADVEAGLADDLTRDACARWLARHHGMTIGSTAPTWYLMTDPDPVWWIMGAIHAGSLDHSEREADCLSVPFHDSDNIVSGRYAVRVPGISALTDPAAALALACLAAGGR